MSRLFTLLAIFLAFSCGCTDYQTRDSRTKKESVISGSSGNATGGGTRNPPKNSQNYPPPVQPPFELIQPPTSDRIDDDYLPFFDEGVQVQSDVSFIRREQASDLAFTRYLSLSFLDFIEFPTREEKIAHKMDIIDSMSIVLNHLSTEDVIVKPQAINKAMSLFRIDLRDYGWSPQQWEAIVTGLNGSTYPYLNDFDPSMATLQQLLQTKVPIVRADWFLFEATKPKSYHDLVRIPSQLKDLETSLGVNRANNILASLEQVQSRAARAALGPGQSGVSINNRIVERHRANNGAYWVTYDFAAQANDPTKSIFTSPIGPLNITKDSTVNFNGITFFNPDGGEVIFNLRNGLQGYMLVDGVGNRIDEAPTFVVFDPRAKDNEGIIVNGLSCMECHATGILPANDTLRSFIANADDQVFNDNVRDAIAALHPDKATLQNIFNADNQPFLRAIDESLMVGKRNSVITQIINYYDQNMNKTMVASELNITVAQLDHILPRLSVNLRSALQPCETGGLERETFEQIFAQLLEEVFGLQQQLKAKAQS